MFELNRLYNLDCMEAMKEIPDKFFEVAITDPPYGIGIDGQRLNINKNPKHSRKAHEKKDWDKAIPSAEYFRELERVSVNQIIWGGNYFVEHLRKGTKGWIVWDKGQHGLSMSDCELAYTTFQKPTRIVVINRAELQKDHTFHPTQKPIRLYEWVIQNYTAAGDKILDTHAGSGACLRAAYRTGHIFLGFEIEKDYFTKADERLRDEMAQMRFDFLFGGGIQKHRRKRRGSRRHKIKRTLKTEKRKTKNDRFGSVNPKRSSRTQLKLKPSNSIRRVR